MNRSSVLRSPISVTMAAVALLSAVTAMAQTAPDAGIGQADSNLMQQLQQKQAEVSELNQQLAEIQQATVEANPGLAEQRDALIADIDAKMAESGHDAEASRARIGEIQQQLQGEDLSQQQSEQLTREMRQIQGELQQAQQAALQDQAIQAELQGLNQTMVEAMKQNSPRTDELLTRLQTVQQEYQALMQQAMQTQGGPQSG